MLQPSEREREREREGEREGRGGDWSIYVCVENFKRHPCLNAMPDVMLTSCQKTLEQSNL